MLRACRHKRDLENDGGSVYIPFGSVTDNDLVPEIRNESVWCPQEQAYFQSQYPTVTLTPLVTEVYCAKSGWSSEAR